MSEREVHPVAALFPMLAEDELAELAEDIKQRGLLQPIVLDAEGRVLDGRNRLTACRMADVEPEFTTYDGDDPGGYALAVNIRRRSLSKGQIAMIVAKAYQDYSRRITQEDLASEQELSQSRLSKAGVVLRFAPELAADVMAGKSLDDAYQVAAQRKKEAAELALQHATRVSDSFRRIVGRILATYHTDELRSDVIEHYSDKLGDAMPADITADTIRAAGDYLHMIADAWKADRK